MFCPICGTPVNKDGARFCPTCGSPLPPPITDPGPNQGQTYSGYQATPTQTAPRPMRRANLKEFAKSRLNGRWGIAIGVNLVYGLLVFFSALLGGIPGLILSGVLAYGYMNFFLRLVREDETPDFGVIFDGFNRFGDTCVAGLLIALYTFLWSLLFVIPGIIKGYAYAMTYFIMKDHPELKAGEAITASKMMMKGHKWRLFVLDLSFLGWYILNCFTFGLLVLLYVDPYLQTSRAAFYEDLKSIRNEAEYLHVK